MIIISPAKRQESIIQRHEGLPKQLDQTKALIEKLYVLSPKELKKLLNVSDRIAQEAWEQFQEYHQQGFHSEPSACIDLYQGDVYKSLDVSTLTNEDLAYIKDNLRIISAFYGVLSPMEGIWPYRLEMITKVPGVASLASFWQASAVEELEGSDIIFNLASNAYSETVLPLKDKRWIDIVFQDQDAKGGYRIIAVKAKRMRGMLLRYMVKHRIKTPEKLLGYEENGYTFCEEESSPNRLVFRSA